MYLPADQDGQLIWNCEMVSKADIGNAQVSHCMMCLEASHWLECCAIKPECIGFAESLNEAV